MKSNEVNKTMEEVKSMKWGQNLLIYINLFLSMIYAMAVDSLSTFDVILYAGVLAGMWYIVKMMDDKIKELKSQMNNK